MKVINITIFLFVLLIQCFAQDAHYWTEQYGTRSMLLSNSISGSVEDLGAVFYNPARLGLIESNAFLISGKVYQLSTYAFDTKSAEGRTTPSSQSSFGGAPSLLAGTYRIKGLDKHSFAYSFLGRRRMDINLTEGNSIHGDVLPGVTGEEYLSGDMMMQKKFNEEWMGLSWAYAPYPRFSIGITNFLSVRKQDVADAMQVKAYTNAHEVEMYSKNSSYNYSHLGLVWKIGMAWLQDAFSWGVTLTAPMVSLSGDGSFNYECIYTGFNEVAPVYEKDNQGDLNMTFKTPLSIAGGLGIKFKRGTLHGSAEYFHGVNEYTLMTSAPFKGQSTGVMYQAFLIDELKPVFNFGIGYNYVFSKSVNAYISYSTDFSAAVVGMDSNTTISRTYASTFNSNIYHYGGGVVMHLKRADITLGATLASTNYTMRRVIGFPEMEGDNTQDNERHTNVYWKRWRFIVGISIPFLSDFAKKWEDKLLNSGE